MHTRNDVFLRHNGKLRITGDKEIIELSYSSENNSDLFRFSHLFCCNWTGLKKRWLLFVILLPLTRAWAFCQ